jgi:TatA/E family protein of Tat protein translocase
MATIAVIALIVFGPRRLPEIARKAGKALRELRSATAELKAGIEAEYEEALGPLDQARREVRSALDEIDPRRTPYGRRPQEGAPAPKDPPDPR